MPRGGALIHEMPLDDDPARAVVRFTRAHNGAISTAQLRAARLTRHAILARVKRGRLVPQFRGV